jgi:Ser/Thr protein kinase RdoA (MazF antagonist)
VPRPLVATYAPPSSLRRWLPVTESAVRGDPEADVARLLRDLVRRLRLQWLPATGLPVQLVHGDVRLSNVCRTPAGKTVYLDFGFLAVRPRIHEISYALAFMALALDGHRAPQTFAWQGVPRLIEAYEDAAHARLTAAERRALAPGTAAVLLYHAALDGFANDPAGQLRARLPALRLSDHPSGAGSQGLQGVAGVGLGTSISRIVPGRATRRASSTQWNGPRRQIRRSTEPAGAGRRARPPLAAGDESWQTKVAFATPRSCAVRCARSIQGAMRS